MHTRSKRPQEIDGVSYFFISKKEFDRKVKNEEFLEHAEVFGNLYGTPRDWVLSTLEKKKSHIRARHTGCSTSEAKFPDAITIFIIPPCYEDLEKRLQNRDQDSAEVIKSRLKEAKKEVLDGKNFDSIIVNNEFNEALQDLKTLMFTEKETHSRKKISCKSFFRSTTGLKSYIALECPTLK